MWGTVLAHLQANFALVSVRHYIAIDLKAFYASVECVERGLNPLDTCLVVADESRTEKTICLAVSPALKTYGISARPRLFEVVQRVREINRARGRMGVSTSGSELARRPDIAVGYIVARPRMRLYIDYSARVYSVYLRHVAPEDIHVYSIDEVFIDAAPYLRTYRMTARQLAMTIIREVLAETGITATAGIGTNMYLCKVAMDIEAKKMPPDQDGVRIAELDEMSYRQKLWSHTPLTDFWRLGRGYARKLQAAGLYTMGDIARASLSSADWFYKCFGVNAELLIDHAWGWEPLTMEIVKAYRPATRSMSSGQVLSRAYTFDKAMVVIREMAGDLALTLIDKGLVTNQITLTIGYDAENIANQELRTRYHGSVTMDHYGRPVPRHSHGTSNFDSYTSSSRIITLHVVELFTRIVNPELLVRRLSLSINRLIPEMCVHKQQTVMQLDLFTDYEALKRQCRADADALAKERRCQEAILKLHKRFGKNSILRGLNYADGATQRDRNRQIGGHNA